MSTVLITGAAKGLGAATAECFARAGYRVIITYLNTVPPGLNPGTTPDSNFGTTPDSNPGTTPDSNFGVTTGLNPGATIDSKSNATDKLNPGATIDPNYITTPAGRIEAYRVDGRDSGQVNDFARRIPCPDVLINNAGIAQIKQIQDISDADWHNMIDSNLSSAFYFARAFAPAMISRRSGLIINVASIWGEQPASCESHYSASKAGLIALSRSLDAELAPSGVRVKYIAPGAIETDMMAYYTFEDRRIIEAELGKIKSPQQVAEEIFELVLPGGIEPPTKL